MNATRASLLAVATLIAGGVIGALLSAHFHQRQRHQFVTDSTASAMGYTLSELDSLRTGRTNEAIRTMEQEFDYQILVLHSVLKNAPADERHERHRSLLERARSYRAAHPGGAIVFPK